MIKESKNMTRVEEGLRVFIYLVRKRFEWR